MLNWRRQRTYSRGIEFIPQHQSLEAKKNTIENIHQTSAKFLLHQHLQISLEDNQSSCPSPVTAPSSHSKFIIGKP